MKHRAKDCTGDYDDEYVIRTDSDGDWVMYENGALEYADGDPRQFALINYCPFCGIKLIGEDE